MKKLDKAASARSTLKLSAEEVEQTISLLSTEDIKRRFFIGNLILQQGSKALPQLVEAMAVQGPEVRRTVAYTLGKLAMKLQTTADLAFKGSVDALYRALLDDDPKVRRNSAVALGDLKLAESADYLIKAVDAEVSPWVRTSMILSLGSIGGETVVDYLSSCQVNDPSEQAALLKALDRCSTVTSNWQFRDPETAIPVELWTPEGLEDVLKADVKGRWIAPCRIRTITSDICGLFASRTFSELLVPLSKAALDSENVTAAVIEKLQRDDVLDRILSLHKSEDERSILRYRLEIRGDQLDHRIRRTMITEITAAIAAACPKFVTSPSNYDLEIRVILDDKTVEILFRPSTITDTRFNYRLEDVPASINPVVAAGIMRLAPNRSAEARILDPFCGSGTMLIERAFAGGYKEMVGVDISAKAIEAAKENVNAAGVANITLIKDDMRNLSQQPFDEIITNMPFGIRTGKHDSNETLYKAIFEMMPKLLAEDGLVMLYTQEVKLTTALFSKSRYLKLIGVHRISAGGLKPAVFVGTMRRRR